MRATPHRKTVCERPSAEVLAPGVIATAIAEDPHLEMMIAPSITEDHRLSWALH